MAPLVTIAALGATAPNVVEAQGASAAARLQYARALRADRRFEQALTLLRDLYEETRQPRHLAHLAATEAALGRAIAAEAHLVEALASPWGREDEDTAHEREGFERALATLQERLGWVEVRCDVPRASVRVVPRNGGELPESTEPSAREGCGRLRAMAGNVTVTVDAPLRPRFTTAVMVLGGETTVVDARFEVAQGLRIVGMPFYATLRVEGMPVRSAIDAVALPVGNYAVRVEARGYVSRDLTVAVEPNRVTLVRVRMTPESSAQSGPEVATAAAPPVSASTSRGISPVAWVGFGIAAAGAGTAIALWVAGNDVAAQYRGDCRNGTPADTDCWGRYDEARAQLDRQAVQVNIAWGIAGAGLLTGGIALIASLASGGSVSSPSVQARAGLGSAALEVRW